MTNTDAILQYIQKHDIPLNAQLSISGEEEPLTMFSLLIREGNISLLESLTCQGDKRAIFCAADCATAERSKIPYLQKATKKYRKWAGGREASRRVEEIPFFPPAHPVDHEAHFSSFKKSPDFDIKYDSCFRQQGIPEHWRSAQFICKLITKWQLSRDIESDLVVWDAELLKRLSLCRVQGTTEHNIEELSEHDCVKVLGHSITSQCFIGVMWGLLRFRGRGAPIWDERTDLAVVKRYRQAVDMVDSQLHLCRTDHDWLLAGCRDPVCLYEDDSEHTYTLRFIVLDQLVKLGHLEPSLLYPFIVREALCSFNGMYMRHAQRCAHAIWLAFTAGGDLAHNGAPNKKELCRVAELSQSAASASLESLQSLLEQLRNAGTWPQVSLSDYESIDVYPVPPEYTSWNELSSQTIWAWIWTWLLRPALERVAGSFKRQVPGQIGSSHGVPAKKTCV
jgi:hypothetical protein